MNNLKVSMLLLIASLATTTVFAQTPLLQFKQKKVQASAASSTNGQLKNGAVRPQVKTPQQVKDSIAMAPTHQFLDTVNKPAPFSLFSIKKYNIDTINTYFYNQGGASALQTSSIQNFNGIHTDVSVEFASFLFGPVRLGVGGSFQTKGDTTKENAIKSSLQKIISNGGAINMNFLVPVFFTRSRHDQTHFAIYAQMKNSLNPGIDSTGTTNYSTNLGYTNQTGFDIHFDVGSNDRKARLYLDIPFFYSFSTANVNNQLGLPNFFLAKAEVGAVLGDLVKFNISGPIYSNATKVQHSPFLISLQFSPSQLMSPSN